MNEWLKLPGLFHRSEFEQVIEVDGEHMYLFIPAGNDHAGRQLVAIYCRLQRPSGGPALLDIPPAEPATTEQSSAAGSPA
jgi:hypothetical protein